MNKKQVDAVALSVRSLAMDAVQAANSGHPGLPMGMAELGAYLYGELMNHTPEDPTWSNRDRFVLSAGHGSMFQYALLHLSGYDITMDDIKNFRQVGSKTPGHPEYGHTSGIETTTGPLGQGLANAVGMAIAERMLAGRFNSADHTIVDHYTYVLAGDGCMMEGITSEASSLAGHLGLGKLIVFYDSNKISIDGSTDITFTETVRARYEAYGWQTFEADAYEVDAIRHHVTAAKAETSKPTLIVLRSLIGKGSPNKAGTATVHGAALGEDEVLATRKALGLAEDAAFYVPPEARTFFEERRAQWSATYTDWKKTFESWAGNNSEKKAEWDAFFGDTLAYLKGLDRPSFDRGEKLATRKAGHTVLKAIAAAVPNLVGGSADLAGSNLTSLPDYGVFGKDTPTGRTINFGVREHAMAAISNGIQLHGGFRAFCATFLVFSDYMRPSVRLAALMGIPVVFLYTHDSIFVGEDGPTHEPIEQTMSLRLIPNLRVIRPADAEETLEAWIMAMERTDGPTALALTRQGLPLLDKADGDWQKKMRRGAYVVREAERSPSVVVAATGSEVSLAVDAAKEVGDSVRVVSVPSLELFLSQDEQFITSLFPTGVRVVTVEVGVGLGWDALASGRRDKFSLDTFGASGPGNAVADYLGFTRTALVDFLRR